MKICIPTLDDRGLDGVPSDHFGSAPYFTFVDTESGTCEVAGNAGANHAHGQCRPLEFLGKREVNAIVCRGLGKRAFARLKNAGVDVYVTLERDVRATVDALEGGFLRELTSEEACHGHGSGGGGGHGSGHGRGSGGGWRP
jgi:predicted Fe-Mo cluster-binding NifX family protein